MIGEYTEKMKVVSDNLKNKEFVTTEGEVVKISKRDIELLALDVVNYSEILAGVDKETLANEKSKEILEKIKDQDEFDKFVYSILGNFYFGFYKRIEDKIKPMNYVRFLYLCSYMDYQNRLVKRIGVKNFSIKEDELQEILRIGKTEYYNTKKELLDNEMIIVNDDKSICINENYCKKGKIVKNNMVSKIRIFNNGIKSLYESCNAKEHKKLAFLFDIIKYCHYDYNIICFNPSEELSDKIKTLSVKELCLELGYKNVTDFRRKMMNFKINNKPVFDIHTVNSKEVIQINPMIYYNGNKLDELRSVCVIFKLCE